jgi:hypothetical protein
MRRTSSCIQNQMTNTMMNSFSIEKNDTSWIYVLYVTQTKSSSTFWLIDRILSMISAFSSLMICTKISLLFFLKMRRLTDWDWFKQLTFDCFQDQYLLNDSAYINIIYLIASYKASHTNDSNVRRFNKRLSRVRIDIEHAFEILKDRWRSLTELRLRVRNKKNYIYVIRWIIACVILHNILLNIKDDWDEKEEWWTSEKEDAHDEKLKQMIIRQLNENIAKREHVKEMILSND